MQPDRGDKTVRIAEVDPLSDSAEKGLKGGDVALEVQGVKASSADDVITGIEKTERHIGDAVLMKIQAGDSQRFVVIRLRRR